MTPFGSDVDPDVYCKNATLLGLISSIGFKLVAWTVNVADFAFDMIESTLTHLLI